MFPLQFGSEIRRVTKIQADDFTPGHRDILTHARFQADSLILPDARWVSQFLGAGEEKRSFAYAITQIACLPLNCWMSAPI